MQFGGISGGVGPRWGGGGGITSGPCCGGEGIGGRGPSGRGGDGLGGHGNSGPGLGPSGGPGGLFGIVSKSETKVSRRGAAAAIHDLGTAPPTACGRTGPETILQRDFFKDMDEIDILA